MHKAGQLLNIADCHAAVRLQEGTVETRGESGSAPSASNAWGSVKRRTLMSSTCSGCCRTCRARTAGASTSGPGKRLRAACRIYCAGVSWDADAVRDDVRDYVVEQLRDDQIASWSTRLAT